MLSITSNFQVKVLWLQLKSRLQTQQPDFPNRPFYFISFPFDIIFVWKRIRCNFMLGKLIVFFETISLDCSGWPGICYFLALGMLASYHWATMSRTAIFLFCISSPSDMEVTLKCPVFFSGFVITLGCSFFVHGTELFKGSLIVTLVLLNVVRC